jgi:hypothetical protein
LEMQLQPQMMTRVANQERVLCSAAHGCFSSILHRATDGCLRKESEVQLRYPLLSLSKYWNAV